MDSMELVSWFQAVRRGDESAVAEGFTASPSWLEARVPAALQEPHLEGSSALHVAVEGRQARVARQLIEAGIDLEMTNREGRTALHDAIEYGLWETQELLLERGAVVDVCAAAILGLEARLQELLDEDPRRVDDRTTGLSPLGWAAYGNQVKTAAILLDRGAAMDDGELCCAASVSHLEVGRFLLERGADPNELHPESGANALHAAAAMRYTDDSVAFVRLLLEAGADPAIPTRDGRTALEIAEAGAVAQRQQVEARDGKGKRFDLVIEVLRGAA